MYRYPAISVFTAMLAFVGLAFAAAAPQRSPSSEPTNPPPNGNGAASHQDQQAAETPAEMHARAQRIIANQHRDDEAIEQFDRIEHHIDSTGGTNPHVILDKLYRVVPTGSGTMKILLKDGTMPTDPAEYRHELQAYESILESLQNGNDSKARTEEEKYARRKHERFGFIDAIDEAFIPKPDGQETVEGHLCDIYQLDPNPDYRPRSIFQEALAHVTVKIWVDRQQDQLVRGEAHVTHDISFGGGILGKLYRGGTFTMEQVEVSPGLWLPERYQYDFSGRRLFFSFDEHQVVEASHYRRIGPPSEALALVQNELATGKQMNVDP